MKAQVLTESQINQVNHVLRMARKQYDELFEEGERDIDLTYTLFNNFITLRIIAFNDWRDSIFTATQAYEGKFSDTIEIFDYNENDCIDMWGKNDFEQALEEIQELAECA